MKLNLLDTKGTKLNEIEVPEEIFGAGDNPSLLSQAIRVYLSNQRQGTSKVKSRGEVNRTTAKVWRQKGTGRARHGSRRAPIFVGGGVAHGPSVNTNHDLKLSKKMKRKALFTSISSKVKEGSLSIVSGANSIQPKTKSALEMLANTINYKQGNKVLVVLPDNTSPLIKGGQNLDGVSLTQASRINYYEVISNLKILFLEESLEVLKDTFLDKTKIIKSDK